MQLPWTDRSFIWVKPTGSLSDLIVTVLPTERDIILGSTQIAPYFDGVVTASRSTRIALGLAYLDPQGQPFRYEWLSFSETWQFNTRILNSNPEINAISVSLPRGYQGSLEILEPIPVSPYSQASMALSASRILVPGYNGPLVRVRDFNGVELDYMQNETGSIPIGGLVVRLYDQSLNARHHEPNNLSLAPKIGKINNKLAVDFTGNKGLANTSSVLIFDFVTVLRSPTANFGNFHALLDGTTLSRRQGGLLASGATNFHNPPFPIRVRKNRVPLTSPFNVAPITEGFVVEVRPNSEVFSSGTSIGNYDNGALGGSCVQGDIVGFPGEIPGSATEEMMTYWGIS